MIISDGTSQVGYSKSEVDYVFSSEYKKLRLRVLFWEQKAEPLPSLSLGIPSWGERERERYKATNMMEISDGAEDPQLGTAQ